jgi:hypothetical protein
MGPKELLHLNCLNVKNGRCHENFHVLAPSIYRYPDPENHWLYLSQILHYI